MIQRVVPGTLVVEHSADQAARVASACIARALVEGIGRSGSATIALSGGKTPRDTYVALAREPGVDWTKVRVFWVDERAVAPTDDRSNYRWGKATLIDGARIDADHVHRMPADGADLDAAAREYEQTIRTWVSASTGGTPSFDVVVLGAGDDGHTASLFPGEPTVDIMDRLVAPVAALGAREARLTITRPMIERARNTIVLVLGAEKRGALERAWAPRGDVHDTPVRLVAGCRGTLTWIVDDAACGPA
ncbi:MAG: 6-phosphogluconolactonase [Polyangiaceae bacterium]